MVTQVEKTILEKMLRHNYIGGRHTSTDNIPKGLPKHLGGEVQKALKNLIRSDYIIAKPTSYGLEVSLNPRRLKEIEELIQ